MRIGPRHHGSARPASARAAAARGLLSQAEHLSLHQRLCAPRIAAIKDKLERARPFIWRASPPLARTIPASRWSRSRARAPASAVQQRRRALLANKHTNEYPRLSIEDMRASMAAMGWNRPHRCLVHLLGLRRARRTLTRTLLEEFPASFSMIRGEPTPLFNLRDLDRGMRAAPHRAPARHAQPCR